MIALQFQFGRAIDMEIDYLIIRAVIEVMLHEQ